MVYATDGGRPGHGPPFEPPGPPPWAPGPPPWVHNPDPTRWALIDYAHSWLDTTLYVYVETDVPCHLYLRWTDKEEHIHLHRETDRGLTKMADPKYCFVEWWEVEQNEAGDTYKHTFSFAGWAVCARRWWMFRGTIAGADSPSNTCIFSAHYLDQEDAVSLKHTDLLEKEVDGVIDHADRSITPIKLVEMFNFTDFPLTPTAAPTADYEVTNKKYVDDSIPESTLSALQAKDIQIINDFTTFVQSVSGSGTTTRDLTRGRVSTGTTANSEALIYKDLYLYWATDTERFSIDWDNPIVIVFFAGLGSGGVAGNRYGWLRMSVDTTGGDLALVGVGWRWNRNNARLYAQSHDGVALESTLVSEGVSIHAHLVRLRIEHDPGVADRFYLDDSLVATHTTRVPSGIQHNSARLNMGAENPGAAQDIRMFLNRVLIAKDWR